MPSSKELLWTKDEDDLLLRLTDQGLSAGQISARMPGRSRSAVIGRRHRLGLSKSDDKKKTGPRLSAGAEEILRLRCDLQWPERSIAQALRPPKRSTAMYETYVRRVIEVHSEAA